jgi:hypothetical protein
MCNLCDFLGRSTISGEDARNANRFRTI